LLDQLACVDPNGGTAAGAFDVCHGGDARQRLAPESEADDGVEVRELRQLARGMANECHRELVRSDAHPIIADSNRCAARPAYVDVDAPGAGIERVLHQLLDDRRRPLDHLACRDGVGDLGCEQKNGPAHSDSFARSS